MLYFLRILDLNFALNNNNKNNKLKFVKKSF
jgi:hypothetical protein